MARDLVPHAGEHGQWRHVLDSPVASNILKTNLSRKHNRYSLERQVALMLGYLGRVLHLGKYMQGSTLPKNVINDKEVR